MHNKIIILKNLLHHEEFARRVIPFLKEEYFHDKSESIVFVEIKNFIIKYNSIPTKEAIEISINKSKSLNEEEYKSIGRIMDSIGTCEEQNYQWLLDETEKFCKDKSVYNAIMESIHINFITKRKRKFRLIWNS